MKIIGVILIIFGIVALVAGGISYTKREKVLEIGPLTATAETRERIPLSPIVGVAALIGGVALVVAGGKTKV